MRTSPIWTDTTIARLTTLRASGASMSAIARDLSETTGRPVTRNAVIGKCHRLGPKAAKPAPRRSEPPPRPVAVTAVKPAPAPIPARLTITDLRAGQCRFPVDHDGQHLFCGSPIRPGCPYCETHAALAYWMPEIERRRAA